MAEVYDPIAKDESFKTSESTPRNIADVLAEELKGIADNILPPNASQIAYDNTASGLTATNVQDAIDEVISSQADVIADTMSDLTENKTATVTDGVADFETIDGSLVKSLVVEIEPSQSGSGTPSPDNIRPISGYTEENTRVVGKNFLPLVLANIKSLNTRGTWSDNVWTSSGGTVTMTTDLNGYVTGIKVNGTFSIDEWFRLANIETLNNEIASGSYILNGRPSDAPTNTCLAVGSSGSDYGSGVSVTAPFTGTSCVIFLPKDKAFNNVTFYPMIRKSTNTDSTYEPYHGKTYTTPFNQTVYGGTLDVLTGELTIDTGFITLNGTENCSKSVATDSDTYMYTINTADFDSPFILSAFQYTEPNPNYRVGYAWRGSSNTQIRIGFAEYGTTTIESWKAWLSQNPLQICYRLATPTTISLTPQTVKSLVGENHIQASTGDVLECKFSMLINGDDLAQIIGG